MARRIKNQSRGGTASARDLAYRHIQRKIVTGELASGDIISELSVSKELGISRTPIREALGQLGAEGMVEQTPNRRAVVTKLVRQDIIDLYELREALEVYAVGKASRQPMHPADLAKLQNLADAILPLKDELEQQSKPQLDSDQMIRFSALDLSFHTYLMNLAANARILKVVNDTRLMIRIFEIRRQGHTATLLQEVHRWHSEVVRAIAEQDRERAMHAIAEHIQLSLRERLDDFDHWQIEASLGKVIPRFQFNPSP